MSNTSFWTARLLTVAVAFTLCGVPQLLQAQQAAPPPTPAQQNTPQPQPAEQPQQGIINPSQGPLQPVPPSEQLPEAPSSTQGTQAAPPANAPAQNAPTPQQQPLGTAVGQTGVTTGGPAAKPAGMAIAPAKQRQVRSLLIKVGAIAAAGAAVGIVYGLSKASPSRPPGAK